MSMEKGVDKKTIILFLSLVLLFYSSPSLSGQMQGNVTPIAKNTTVSLKIRESMQDCLFFTTCPDSVVKGSLYIFETANWNCGNQEFNGTTHLKIVDSSGQVLVRTSSNVSLSRLEISYLQAYFSSELLGTYYAMASTSYHNKTIAVNCTFQVIEKKPSRGGKEIPAPAPAPKIISLEPILPRKALNVTQTGTLAVKVGVENTGSELFNLTVEPQPGRGWNKTKAYVSSIEPNETIYRTISVTPSQKIAPSTYVVPVGIIRKGEVVERGFFIVEVRKKPLLVKDLEIVEYPANITLFQGEKKNVSTFIKNTGNITLHNVSLSIENEKDCILPSKLPGGVRLGVGKTKEFSFEVIARKVIDVCNASLIASSQEARSIRTMRLEIREKLLFPLRPLNLFYRAIIRALFLVVESLPLPAELPYPFVFS